MSDETQRQLRQLPRIDYQALGSTGAVILRTPVNERSLDAEVQDPQQQPPSDASAEDVTVNLSEVEVASDEASSVSSAESSTESTLTPASSDLDLLDATLVNRESPEHHFPGNHLQGSLSGSSPVDEDLLNALGEIELTVKMASEARHDILSQISLLIEDLNDYFDENSMNALNLSIEDIDTNIQKAERMRSEFRELHLKLQDVVGETEYKEKHAEKYIESLANIKDYIKQGKTQRSTLRAHSDSHAFQHRQLEIAKEREAAVQKESTSKFLIAEVNRLIKQLNEVFLKNNKTASMTRLKVERVCCQKNCWKLTGCRIRFRS